MRAQGRGHARPRHRVLAGPRRRRNRAAGRPRYSLFSKRTGAPIARLKPTGTDDRVQVLWWNGTRWAASGPFGIATMPLDQALAYIADEPDFWIHA